MFQLMIEISWDSYTFSCSSSTELNRSHPNSVHLLIMRPEIFDDQNFLLELIKCLNLFSSEVHENSHQRFR